MLGWPDERGLQSSAVRGGWTGECWAVGTARIARREGV